MIPVLLLALACSDYGINPKDPDIGADTGVPERDLCDDEAQPGEDIESDLACEMEPQTGQFEPELLWHMETFVSHPGSKSVMATTMVAHITDDDLDGTWGSSGDIPDIVFITYGDADVLRVVSGDGTTEHWSRADSPQGQGAPAVGDLDGDGDPEIVVVTSSYKVNAYHHDGSKMWTSGSLTGKVAQYSSAPAISDMDGNGVVEVIAGAAILNGVDGTTLGMGQQGKGNSGAGGDVGTTSFAVDLDRDGDQEVVTGNALYDIHGTTLAKNGQGDGYVAVGNFDEDDEGEIVVVRDSTVTVYNPDWSVVWGPTRFGSSLGGPPTVADFDGDGAPEVGVAGISIYTVLDSNGEVLWSRPTQDGTSGVTGSAVYDFEGDGIAEVVYADEITLWIFNGPNGDIKLEYTEHASNTWLENPAIADVDGDGHADIVWGHNPYQGGKNYYGISVISDAQRTWTSTRAIWNQEAYHITNVDDDGGIPRSPEINWDSYNNFRSGDMHAGQGSAAPNLVPEVVGTCADSCDEGEAWIWVRLRNQGAASARKGTEISLRSNGAELARLELENDLAAGRASKSMLFRVDPAELGAKYMVVADPDDDVWECNEDDNQEEREEAVCP